jgi:hypothetical protein
VLRRLAVSLVIATIAVLGLGVGVAQAKPTGCAALLGISPRITTALCTGGTGQFRPGIWCIFPGGAQVFWGAWTNPGRTATVACPWGAPQRPDISLRG